MYISFFDCEWDPNKAEISWRKHGLRFVDAVGALYDPLGVTRPDRNPDEERFVTIGRDWLDRIVVLIWTPRDRHTRVISARLATPRERRQYAEGPDA